MIRTWVGVVALLAVALAPAQAPAQKPGATAIVPPNAPAGADMTRGAYLDQEFGYDLVVPQGWKYDSTKVPAADGATATFRGVSPDGMRRIEVYIYHGERVSDFTAWCTAYAKRMATVFGVREVEAHPRVVAARSAAKVEVQSLVKGEAERSQHLLILGNPMMVMALVVTQRGDPDPAIDVDTLARSVNFAGNLPDFAAIDEAFRRGRALLAALRGAGEGVKLEESAQHFRILLEGRELGMVEQRLSRGRMPKSEKPALRWIEQQWNFEPDGAARLTSVDAFASFDGASEQIEFRTVLLPPESMAGARPLIKLDEVIREGDTIVSSISRNTQPDLPPPGEPFTVDANYLGAAWVALLPGMLAELKSQPHAFTIYDPQTRRLKAYQIEAMGGPDGGEGETNEFLLVERFSENRTKIRTDAAGRMQRMQAGGLIWERAEADALQREFGARKANAEKRFVAARQTPAPQRAPKQPPKSGAR
ncbi:MAG: hypothetical protein SF069_07060 [Phycisphaerae bacterium]|nr:hypothetical protein [Phycisphaerae bacterium]